MPVFCLVLAFALDLGDIDKTPALWCEHGVPSPVLVQHGSHVTCMLDSRDFPLHLEGANRCGYMREHFLEQASHGLCEHGYH